MILEAALVIILSFVDEIGVLDGLAAMSAGETLRVIEVASSFEVRPDDRLAALRAHPVVIRSCIGRHDGGKSRAKHKHPDQLSQFCPLSVDPSAVLVET
jgi:hypothetical protein